MQNRLDEIVDFSRLGDQIRHPLYTYSSGMRARLAFSIATSVQPEILIIDEGIGAADEEFSERAAGRLDSFLQNAGILILASHSHQLLDSWCNKKVRLESGQILSRKMWRSSTVITARIYQPCLKPNILAALRLRKYTDLTGRSVPCIGISLFWETSIEVVLKSTWFENSAASMQAMCRTVTREDEVFTQLFLRSNSTAQQPARKDWNDTISYD